MRNLKKLGTGLALVASAATLTALAAGPALADPSPSGTVPALTDVVGVGSDTIQSVFDQFSSDYNTAHSSGPKLYSWDATNPTTGAVGDTITEKASGTSDTTCKVARPDGSGAGITALAAGTKDGSSFCVDYARSSRGPASTDPAGLQWVALGGDAVTWATPKGTSSDPSPAPATLTEAQLVGIYQCTITNWDQVGGANAPIVAALPQANSGTRAFFLSAINGGGAAINPGSCVDNGSFNGQVLQENTGVSGGNGALFGTSTSPNVDAIYPYSIADDIAQTPAPAGGGHATSVWAPGPLGLHQITDPSTGTAQAPIVTGTPDTINPNFPADFQRVVWDVVRFTSTTSDGIPAYLEGIFGASGWLCSSSAGQADLASYGFLSLGSSCGSLTEQG